MSSGQIPPPPCFILKTFFVWHLLLETGSHFEKINFGKTGEVLNYINIVKNQLSSLSRHYQKGLNIMCNTNTYFRKPRRLGMAVVDVNLFNKKVVHFHTKFNYGIYMELTNHIHANFPL